ncbi:MAG: bifunctional helix-turn-helix domain-containing protein/methylated-DNA--[protein]-cysteine S-methyltransferase [Rhodospirillales bacterium]|nr:MAG: bifunctional helix-turn-helix domain-containing protein/methylated-DNA--[protein]-cysteine S-methyltransferase [Rhodospirillales bacterium]
METAAMLPKDESRPALPQSGGADAARIARTLDRLASRFPEQPSLAELAVEAGVSAHHFQRMFTRWAGVSPKKFLQHLTLEAAKQRLRQSASVLDAAYDAGLSGPGRLHDLFVTFEATTPGEYKTRGEGLTIEYGFHDSPFGECLLMVTARGICGLGFVAPGERDAALAVMSRGWERARIRRDDAATVVYIPRIFARPGEVRAHDASPLRLFLRGSRFQLKVWQALLTMPPGTLTTYQDLARRLGLPRGAARAIGNANGANPVPWLIPCHRVIRKTGALGGYAWGEGCKMAMIGWEAVAADAAPHGLSAQGSSPPQAMNGGFSKPGLP